MSAAAQPAPVRIVGRYALYEAIAAGGMATVHLGRLRGPVGFARTVAIKRLHPEYARDPEFVSMFLDEARLAARIRHPNVVQTIDVVAEDGELFLVMDYVQGESLSRLLRLVHDNQKAIPHRVVTAIMSGALQGLHAAHEARDERGENLGLVHRDVSPQNILIGADGLTRVLDFGVAKAAGRVHTTREGRVKGKLAYMAPEQIQSGEITRAADIYSASVVLWEALTGRRLFHSDNQTTVLARILAGNVTKPSAAVPGLPAAYDAVVLKGLSRAPKDRFNDALEMAHALEECAGLESHAAVARWMEELAGRALAERAERVADIERGSGVSDISEISGSLLQSAPTSAPPRAAQDRSGVISLTPAPRMGLAPKLWITAGVLTALLIVASVALAVRSSRPAPSVESIPTPASEPATTEAAPAKPPPTMVTAQQEPEDDKASTGPTAPSATTSAPRPTPRAWRPAAKVPAAKKKSDSPFDGLGGRL